MPLFICKGITSQLIVSSRAFLFDAEDVVLILEQVSIHPRPAILGFGFVLIE